MRSDKTNLPPELKRLLSSPSYKKLQAFASSPTVNALKKLQLHPELKRLTELSASLSREIEEEKSKPPLSLNNPSRDAEHLVEAVNESNRESLRLLSISNKLTEQMLDAIARIESSANLRASQSDFHASRSYRIAVWAVFIAIIAMAIAAIAARDEISTFIISWLT